MTMGRLIYSAIASLDGYIEDEGGRFDWAKPSDEVHAYVNEIERGIGTSLYGRGMYETMAVWETVDTGPEQTAVVRDYAELWRATDKVVFSSSLPEDRGKRTRLERSFDAAEIRAMKAAVSEDLSIGGPTLAASAFEADLVDECHLFLHPVVIGGGKRALPNGIRLELELLDEHRFTDGVVHLHYGRR